MPCYYPVHCYRLVYPNANGTRPIIHATSQIKGRDVMPWIRACGGCIGCRLEKSRQTAVRCVHEASLHRENSYLTLTYSPENLPENGSLVTSDMQDFWKRLRKRLKGKLIKYFAAGEYGDRDRRPHYHACLFRHDFDDKKYHKMSNGFPLYVSPLLTDIWGEGHVYIGDVTFESAAYVARYCVKKVTGKNAKKHYEELGILPERCYSSIGLADEWYQRYKNDVYNHDYVVIRGVKCRPPKRYDRLLLGDDPLLLEELKLAREKDNSFNINLDQTFFDGKTMAVSEAVKIAQLRNFKLDNERSST